MAKHQDRDPDKWRQRVQGWHDSGLDAGTYAQQHDLSSRALKWWARWMQKQQAVPRGATEVPLGFVQVQPRPEPSPPTVVTVEVVLRGGRVLRVPTSISDSDLARMATTLEGLACSRAG